MRLLSAFFTSVALFGCRAGHARLEFSPNPARPDGYPTRVRRLTDDERTVKLQAFRARNAALPWLAQATLTPFGFVTFAQRVDDAPAVSDAEATASRPFSAEELAWWRALLERNAAEFGLTNPSQLDAATSAQGIEIEQRLRGRLVGQLRVYRGAPYLPSGGRAPRTTIVTGHLWPTLAEPSSLLDDREITRRIVGRAVDVVAECPTHPCDPGGPGQSCPASPRPTRSSRTLLAEDLAVRTEPRPVYLAAGRGPVEVRLVTIVELNAGRCPEDVRCGEGAAQCWLDAPSAREEFGDRHWLYDAVTGAALRGVSFSPVE